MMGVHYPVPCKRLNERATRPIRHRRVGARLADRLVGRGGDRLPRTPVGDPLRPPFHPSSWLTTPGQNPALEALWADADFEHLVALDDQVGLPGGHSPPRTRVSPADRRRAGPGAAAA